MGDALLMHAACLAVMASPMHQSWAVGSCRLWHPAQLFAVPACAYPLKTCCCRKVRVFRFATGKLSRAYDESLEAANELQRSESGIVVAHVGRPPPCGSLLCALRRCRLLGAAVCCCLTSLRIRIGRWAASLLCLPQSCAGWSPSTLGGAWQWRRSWLRTRWPRHPPRCLTRVAISCCTPRWWASRWAGREGGAGRE